MPLNSFAHVVIAGVGRGGARGRGERRARRRPRSGARPPLALARLPPPLPPSAVGGSRLRELQQQGLYRRAGLPWAAGVLADRSGDRQTQKERIHGETSVSTDVRRAGTLRGALQAAAALVGAPPQRNACARAAGAAQAARPAPAVPRPPPPLSTPLPCCTSRARGRPAEAGGNLTQAPPPAARRARRRRRRPSSISSRRRRAASAARRR